MKSHEVQKTRVVVRFIDIGRKWYLCHANSYQNAFRSTINGFPTREDAVQFAEGQECVVEHHPGGALQALDADKKRAETLYHETSSANAASILRDGLLASKGKAMAAVFLTDVLPEPKSGFSVFAIASRDLMLDVDWTGEPSNPGEKWYAVWVNIPASLISAVSEGVRSDVCVTEDDPAIVARFPVGTVVGARRWPYSANHPGCWQTPWKGVVLPMNDLRVWAGNPSLQTQEKIDQHVAWCRKQGLLRETLPVLWDFGNEQVVYFQTAKDNPGAHDLRLYAEDYLDWQLARDTAYRREAERSAARDGQKPKSADLVPSFGR